MQIQPILGYFWVILGLYQPPAPPFGSGPPPLLHILDPPLIIVSKSHKNTSKYVNTVTFFAKNLKGHWPLDDLWPHICGGHMCDSTQGSLCPKSHEHTSKYVDTVTFFCKKKTLNQRSLTPRWPLTPHLLRSHVWIYSRSLCPAYKSHKNTSKYVDTVNLFAKTWTKGHWPLDDLWHVWLYPRIIVSKSHGNTSMYVDGYSDQFWQKILQITTYIHVYIHIHTYYVQNQWSHSLFLNYIQARTKSRFLTCPCHKI